MMFHRVRGTARRAARGTAGGFRILAQPGSRRWNSTQGAGGSSKLPWAIGGLLVGGSGVYLTNGSSRPIPPGPSKAAIPLTAEAPPVGKVSSEVEIPVVSPIKIVDLQEADARLRQNTSSFVFDSKDGAKGRVDVIKYSSNNPVEDEWALGVGGGVGGAKTLYAGVYDGHAGWSTSSILKTALIPYVSTALGKLSPSTPGDGVDAAIKVAFTNLDDRIMTNATSAVANAAEDADASVVSALAPALAGSCALLSIYDVGTSTLRTAVTGDSRAVLGSWSTSSGKHTADPVSKDQTGFNEDEVERLDKAHPGEKETILDPKSGRLMGLAVTRAFGDSRWKWTTEFIKSTQGHFFGYGVLKQESKTPPYLTASPEVTTRQVQGDDFVILASDGLWDCISSDDAVACVSRWLAAKRAGKPEAVTPVKTELKAVEGGWISWKATPEFFAIEDMDSAAVCLVKNAFGGTRRSLFCGVMSVQSPMSRYVRDDITVQVIFFKDPYQK